MTLQEFGLFVISIIASIAGQGFLKAGALKLGRVNVDNIVSHVLNIATTPELVIGLTCYAMGAIAYILVLTRVKLSIAAPAVALSYIFPVLIGHFVFRESIPPMRLAGLGLIISGVVLLIRQP